MNIPQGIHKAVVYKGLLDAQDIMNLEVEDLLIIETPNALWYELTHIFKKDDTLPKSLFTPTFLCHTLEKCGYKIIQKNWLYSPTIVIIARKL